MNAEYFDALITANLPDLKQIVQITQTSLVRSFPLRMDLESLKVDVPYSIFSFIDLTSNKLVVIDISDIDVIIGTVDMILPTMA